MPLRDQRRPWLLVLVGLAMVFAGTSIAVAQEALLMPGKSELYQRVLTRPGAVLRDAPAEASASGDALPPLSLFYVYQRRRGDTGDWLQLGAGPEDDVAGWLPAGQAIDWSQTLTVAFRRNANRSPALFFRDRTSLEQVLQSELPAREVERLRKSIDSGQISDGFPVIAEEPDTYVDPNREFYLLPILDHDQVYLESGLRTTVLNVAAVTLQAGEQDLLRSAEQDRDSQERDSKPAEQPERDYQVGIVFVIDSTTSMGPYIDRTRSAINRLYDRLKDSAMGDALSFGLVAFRDNTETTPDLDYVSRVAATLDDGRDRSSFFAKVNRVEPATVSSRGFKEDAFAGVYDAIEQIDWRGYDGRFVVLITDAGARDATDPLSRTGFGPERLRLLAQEKDQAAGGGKIAIAALHLLTPDGAHDHQQAAAQYRELTRWGQAGDLYFPVQGGSVDQFGEQVDTLADALLAQIEGVRSGRAIEIPANEDASEVERKTALVGRAMQLAYLGRETGSRAPRLIDAWVSDRDIADPTTKSLEVRVLITKNQISNLQETLQAIFEAGEQTTMSAKDFFAQLRGAAAALARDPDKVSTTQVRRLADVGLVGEWLDDLPYTSQVMNLTESRWLSRSYAQQQEVLDVIEEKILLYRRIHDDTDRWIDLSGRATKGEAVTTMPLDALP
ncbi:MAG: VWA domain-containing protein [Chromatiaceae bacterium]|nr:VWA domain-containing protein [Chromatiaceae bacterium]